MSTENMVIMVTGGSGLVGKAIKQVTTENPRSNEKFIFLSSEDGNLMYVLVNETSIHITSNINTLSIHRDPIDTKNIFETHRPTHVIHLAAKVGGLFDNMRNNIDYLVCQFVIITIHPEHIY